MPDPYLSEIKYLGGANEDFIEIAVDPGSSVADLYVVNYNQNGTVKSTTQLTAAGVSGPTLVGGRDIYVVDDSSNFNGLNKKGAIALVQSADGVTADNVFGFYSFDDQPGTVTATAGLANGLTSQDIGAAPSGQSLIIKKSTADANADDSGSYTINTSPTPGSIPCFTPGTLITTVTGQIPVEALKPGDLVITLDNGLQPVRWKGSRRVSGVDRFNPKMRPVCVPAGGSAYFLAAQDLFVSPNHCLLLSDPQNALRFGAHQVLVPAGYLFPTPTTDRTLPPAYDYIHLQFDQQQIIVANRQPGESLQPGHCALA
ncbi:MAG: Hint domain-containing protein, partial [Pseudomonadota bacterium]